MPNRLVITLGTSWEIVPELIGFVNPNKLGLYDNHSQSDEIQSIRNTYHIQEVDEFWIITTGGSRTEKSVKKLLEWNKEKYFDIRIYRLKDVNELATVDECESMADYIYRTVLHASDGANKLYLSLSGGRKTMSADMQQAGTIFGCDAMLHVAAKDMTGDMRGQLDKEIMTGKRNSNLVDNIMPIVAFGKTNRNPILDITTRVIADNYELDKKGKLKKDLYCEIQTRLKDAKNLLYNHTNKLLKGTSNFRALYYLPPDRIEKLKETQIDYQFVKQIPKAELHCHFGGIGSAEDLIDIAGANELIINEAIQTHPNFKNWLKKIRGMVLNHKVDELKKNIPDVKKLRTLFKELPEPITVAGFLLQFKGFIPVLDAFIYGDLVKEENFTKLGIRKYEQLGDLQGSGLLQTEMSIQKASRILVKNCEEDNVRYCEVRCSPVKYTRGGLSAQKVVEIMINEFTLSETTFRILFIASRHGDMKEIEEHIHLAQQMLKASKNFKKYFVGFDLAGDESARTPKELRTIFLPLLEDMAHITIHAGETEDVNSIWQAVYHLNADRIGHGLTLIHNKKLLNKFIDKKITVEMCPSSNHQIIGFNREDYPLREYLERGIKVTLNTDNPGISRTTLSNEFIMAQRITKGGLTQWEALKIIRNAFLSVFTGASDKHKLILNVEEIIVNYLLNDG